MSANLIRGGLLALALAASGSAAAADLNYNYVEGGFGELEGDGDALFFNGAFDIAKNVGLVGGVYFGDYDPNVDVTGLEFGVQYHQALKSNMSFHAGIKLLHIEAEWSHPVFGNSYEADDTGFIANAGMRFKVQPNIQLEGDLKLSSNDMLADDGLGAQVAARFYINDQFSIAPGLAVDTELDGIFVGLRYDL